MASSLAVVYAAWLFRLLLVTMGHEGSASAKRARTVLNITSMATCAVLLLGGIGFLAGVAAAGFSDAAIAEQEARETGRPP